MLQHPGIDLQLQGFFNGVGLTAFVTCLLHHAKDPVVAFNMIVGALAVFPPQKDDHLVKLVFAQLVERLGQKIVGLVAWIVDHSRATIAGTSLADAFCKEAVKLLVELSKQLQVGCNGQHERQVFLFLLAEVFWFTNDEILMLPDEGGLLFLAHTLARLSLLSGFLAGTTATLLTAFVALSFDTVFDCPAPRQGSVYSPP